MLPLPYVSRRLRCRPLSRAAITAIDYFATLKANIAFIRYIAFQRAITLLIDTLFLRLRHYS